MHPPPATASDDDGSQLLYISFFRSPGATSFPSPLPPHLLRVFFFFLIINEFNYVKQKLAKVEIKSAWVRTREKWASFVEIKSSRWLPARRQLSCAFSAFSGSNFSVCERERAARTHRAREQHKEHSLSARETVTRWYHFYLSRIVLGGCTLAFSLRMQIIHCQQEHQQTTFYIRAEIEKEKSSNIYANVHFYY